MNTVTPNIRLSGAQRQALKKLYVAHCSGGTLRGWQIGRPVTAVYLVKVGLLKGDIYEWGNRKKNVHTEGELTELGYQVAHSLFCMDWWSELMTAYIQHIHKLHVKQNAIVVSKAISEKFGFTNSHFVFRERLESYIAKYDDGVFNVIVELDPSRLLKDVRYYNVRIVDCPSMSPSEARELATILQEAAQIADVLNRTIA